MVAAARKLVSLSFVILHAAMRIAVFFFNDTATTEIYTLSLHDALPIWRAAPRRSSSKAASRWPRPFGAWLISTSRDGPYRPHATIDPSHGWPSRAGAPVGPDGPSRDEIGRAHV